jgi:hypothetical protein
MGTLGVRRHDLPANGNVLVDKRLRRVSLGTSLGLLRMWPRGNGPRERRYSPAFRCGLARGNGSLFFLFVFHLDDCVDD